MGTGSSPVCSRHTGPLVCRLTLQTPSPRPPPRIHYPPELPVSGKRDEIVAALAKHQVVIVAGETGSGKTTQLPKMCLERLMVTQARGRIGCTQPRRMAATSVSRRVAEELNVQWGREVGCKVRFGDDTSRETLVKFMTDGILLAEIQSDPMLRAYSILIVDEAHERSLNIDFLLGHLRGLLKRRPDLQVVITSATIDTQAFSAAFENAPIIEASGRLFPVEVRYRELADEEGEGLVEDVVTAVEEAFIDSDDGDILVFLATERDIRDTCDALTGALGNGFEVLGLFGRMASADQQRIFSPGPRRRVIVSTNVAETSLTLPRIRHVSDSGLARISRYNPRTRPKRLPVEPVAQSSANQRAGRAGRVRNGVCVRLYTHEDFAARPQFTQPEIQRANLAEVILRMKAFRLGDVETFPFLHPPSNAAIQTGYTLLHELGALNDEHEMTPLGHELARLPIDPTLGRMMLQAEKEGVLPELLVIAAGLSIPDPRERPEDAKEAAAAAHRTMADPESDFLTLLRIWRAMPPAESRNALRRWAKSNFYNASRLREWRDLHRQLADAMDVKPVLPDRDIHYAAIHRSVLTGLLGHVAMREERNIYKTTGNRLTTIFPGSGLFVRGKKPAQSPRKLTEEKGQAPSQPQWIMAAEIVETSALYARTVARILPEWIAELGAHLCSQRYSDPHWDAKAGRVLATERMLLSGLEVARKLTDYGRIDPKEATEIFIRGALITADTPIQLRFFAENQRLRVKMETALTRVRNHRALVLDEMLYRFYAARIEGVSSIHDLHRIVKARLATETDFLCATETDLLGDAGLDYDRDAFPEQVRLANTVLPLSYEYNPGDEKDGVTVSVPLPVARALTSGQLQWMVPGMRADQIGTLLRALPKSIRKMLQPIEPKVREIAATFDPGQGEFLSALAAHIQRTYCVALRAEDWPPESLPAHLMPRIHIVDDRKRVIASGRDLSALHGEIGTARTPAWERAAREWERPVGKSWSFGDLPEKITVEQIAGTPHFAWPTLSIAKEGAAILLCHTCEEAEKTSIPAVRQLAEIAAVKDIAWLAREFRQLGLAASRPAKPTNLRDAFTVATAKLVCTATPWGTPESLCRGAIVMLTEHALRLSPTLPLTEARFLAMLAAFHRNVPVLARKVIDGIAQIVALRHAITSSLRRYPALDADLARLLPADFPAGLAFAQFTHIPRYLRTVQLRAERATLAPAKDAEKARQLAPFFGWEKRVAPALHSEFRWILEEFRVSLFAQELGTPSPVSAQRLSALGGL